MRVLPVVLAALALTLSAAAHPSDWLDGLVPGDRVSLHAGATDVATVRQRETRGATTTWRGDLSGGGTWTLVRRADAIAGIAFADDGAHRLHVADGRILAEAIDAGGFAPCGCGPEPGGRLPDGAPAAGSGTCDDGTVIDVMVLYTPIARFAAGSVNAIEAEILLAVDVTNQAYANSLVPTQIQLVHLAEVNYDENGSYSQHLGRLRSPDDGYMDDAHAIRETVRADMVSLIVDDGQFCGIAYLMNSGEVSTDFEDSAFSVTSWFCAAGNLSFAHELGHNMGCHHDRGNASSQPAFDFSYGYRWDGDSDQWRSVMAYSPGIRVPHFSNPDISYDGGVTGVPEGTLQSAHNALTIELTSPIVANFRCSDSADLDGDGDVDVEDLLALLGSWGPCSGCPADIDGSGAVDIEDLLLVLGQWG